MAEAVAGLVGVVLGLGCIWLAFRPADELTDADRPRWSPTPLLLSLIPSPIQRVLFFVLGLFILGMTYEALG